MRVDLRFGSAIIHLAIHCLMQLKHVREIYRVPCLPSSISQPLNCVIGLIIYRVTHCVLPGIVM